MKLKSVYVISGIVLACLALLTMDAVTLDNFILLPKTGHRKPAIYFNHKSHSEEYSSQCIDCHHTGENKKCNNCHRQYDTGNIINIKAAFHQQCHECHRKTSGPKACSRCHKN